MSEFQKEFFERTDKKVGLKLGGFQFSDITKLAYFALQYKFDEIFGV